MKRERSPSTSPSPPTSDSSLPVTHMKVKPESEPAPATPTPSKSPKTKGPKTPSTPKGPATPKAKSSPSLINGTWTPEKRGQLMEEVIAAGYKALDLDSSAERLEMSKRQLIDQLIPNRPGNMRGKAVKGAKGE